MRLYLASPTKVQIGPSHQVRSGLRRTLWARSKWIGCGRRSSEQNVCSEAPRDSLSARVTKPWNTLFMLIMKPVARVLPRSSSRV